MRRITGKERAASASRVTQHDGDHARCYRYRLLDREGRDAGEAAFVDPVRVDQIVVASDGRRLRVLDIAPINGPSEPYLGSLKVESAA